LIRKLRRYLHTVCAEAGIAKRIVPHQMRHYAAFRTMPRENIAAATDRPPSDHRCGIADASSNSLGLGMVDSWIEDRKQEYFNI